MKKIAIIDVGTGETVRSTMGYDGFILYAAMKDDPSREVTFFDDCTPYQIFLAPRFDVYIVHVWNYHQLPILNWIRTQMPGEKFFIGYSGFKELTSVPFYPGWTDETIIEGIKKLPELYNGPSDLKYSGLRCDCDHHISTDDTRPVFPLFLSYGCPCQCSFCPVPVCRAGSKDARLALNVDEAMAVVEAVVETEKNIHFFDEDFFIDRAFTKEIIPRFIQLQRRRVSEGKQPFKWIALTTVPTLANAIRDFGQDALIEAGLFLAEMGLESNDPDIRKLMKKTGSADQIGFIIENGDKINKLWLALTFFPGETITTLNNMGEFLMVYGLDPDQTGDRLLTNGNICGLGQFFQWYHGTSSYDITRKEGLLLEANQPLRLVPSYIPQSFLDCKPQLVVHPADKWVSKFSTAVSIYNLDKYDFGNLQLDGTLTIDEIRKTCDIDTGDLMIYLALLARFGYIIDANKEKN